LPAKIAAVIHHFYLFLFIIYFYLLFVFFVFFFVFLFFASSVYIKPILCIAYSHELIAGNEVV